MRYVVQVPFLVVQLFLVLTHVSLSQNWGITKCLTVNTYADMNTFVRQFGHVNYMFRSGKPGAIGEEPNDPLGWCSSEERAALQGMTDDEAATQAGDLLLQLWESRLTQDQLSALPEDDFYRAVNAPFAATDSGLLQPAPIVAPPTVAEIEHAFYASAELCAQQRAVPPHTKEWENIRSCNGFMNGISGSRIHMLQ